MKSGHCKQAAVDYVDHQSQSVMSRFLHDLTCDLLDSPQWLGTDLRRESYDLRLACDLHMCDLLSPLPQPD